MKQTILKRIAALAMILILVLSLAACGTEEARTEDDGAGSAAAENNQTAPQNAQSHSGSGKEGWSDFQSDGSTGATADSGSALDTEDLFSNRDLKQTADLSEAVTCTVSDGSDISITAEGVYVLTGTAKNVTVVVEAGEEDKVQLVLDGLSVVNDDAPVIYVKSADKVFVTTAEGSENSLSVTGTFTADGSVNTDAVIFARDDLVLNGLGSLTISSTDNGISCKDDLKITGGTLFVNAQGHGLEANDSIAVADGTITVTAKQDGLHAENDDDDREGWIWLCGGTLTVTAGDDGLHAVSILQIDGGELTVSAAEGLEATWVRINSGTVSVTATDDGVNAGQKSSAYTPCVEINGGSLSIDMGRGDTDAVDSNGNLIITGGTITINAQSAFDWDGTLTRTGGTVIVNGTETDEITNQFGGGFGGEAGSGGQGGFGGGSGDHR